jgi:adenylylsulfate kinase
MSEGRVIWITGLSGSGKTTLAVELVKELRLTGHPVIFFDGEELRGVLGTAEYSTANHGREVRLALAMKYARLCKLVASQGFVVIIATISMFSEIYSWNRGNLPGYFEVYLNAQPDELRKLDPKGIYKRFDAGVINSVAGLDLSIDEPVEPDIRLDFKSRADPKLTALLIKKRLLHKEL